MDWNHLPLTPEHADFLAEHAVLPEIADLFGVFSVTQISDLPEGFEWAADRAVPAIAFPWYTPGGVEAIQLKPDTPVQVDGEKRPRKYLQAKGVGSLLGEMREDTGSDLVLIVEGTKQALATVGYTDSGSVYAVAGCRNWSVDGIPVTDLGVVEGKRVIVAFDADIETNRDVWVAAERFTVALKAEGATEVSYLIVPGGAKTSLDDVLGARAHEKRAPYLSRLLEMAQPKLPPRPAQTSATTLGNPYIDPRNGGLQAAKLSEAVLDRYPAALTQEDRVAVYRDGAYRIEGSAFLGALAGLLGDHYRKPHRGSVEEYTVGVLSEAGIRLPTHTTDAVANVANGMLDLVTGALKPHDPAYLSSIQFPVVYDPEATCPVYEAWLEAVIPGQVEDLEETAAQMLDPSRTPAKALFLYGPSRSGKSTFLRILSEVAGVQNTSAVTLHQLSGDRFAAANVFGKALNCAADLSAAHVEDMSVFKTMTGEDMIMANRKYGGQFTFTNRALFAFSANELPTVGESSRAYAERVKPFRFSRSFAGSEDPTIEDAIRGEHSGILNRWLAAWQRRNARGRSLETDAVVMHDFETRSDRVRQWLDEVCLVVSESHTGVVSTGSVVQAEMGTGKRELAKAFNAWAAENHAPPMGERKIIDRLTSVNGVFEVRVLPSKNVGLNIVKRPDGYETGVGSVTSSPPCYRRKPTFGEGVSPKNGFDAHQKIPYSAGWVENHTSHTALNDRQKRLGRSGTFRKASS
jgi:putative DNA primase/helicase